MSKEYTVERLSAIMNNIIRYCTTPSLIKESVSDHSFMISLLIIEASTDYPELFKYVNRENLLIRAILHDLSETITGDIPSPAKRFIPQYESSFSDIEIAVSNKLAEGRSDEFKQLLLTSIKFDNENNLEELLFKVFDYLCVLIKASNEIYLGNKYYKRVIREMTIQFNRLKDVIEAHCNTDEGYNELYNYYSKEVISRIDSINCTVKNM